MLVLFLSLETKSGCQKRLLECWSWSPLRCISRNKDMELVFWIKSFLHAADNHPLSNSWKSWTIIQSTQSKLQAYGIFQKDLSIDESMAPYYEGHSYKQFICAKQIRFVYKPWIPAGATGLPCNIEIHAEKSVNDTGEPLETRLLKNGLDVFERPRIHSVYFDDFFLSYQLLSGLDKKGFRATGTMKIQEW